MFGAGPALAADSGPLHGAWTDRPGRPQAVRGRVTLQGLTSGGRARERAKAGTAAPPALTGRTRARPTRFREPPRPPPGGTSPGAWALAGGLTPPLAAGLGPRPSRRPRLPATSTARRRMPFPPAARLQARARIPVSDLPGAARAKPPVAPVPPIDGRRAYMRAGGKPNFGTAAGRARMPGRLRKNCL